MGASAAAGLVSQQKSGISTKIDIKKIFSLALGMIILGILSRRYISQKDWGG
jgi:hypothetical protein